MTIDRSETLLAGIATCARCARPVGAAGPAGPESRYVCATAGHLDAFAIICDAWVLGWATSCLHEQRRPAAVTAEVVRAERGRRDGVDALPLADQRALIAQLGAVRLSGTGGSSAVELLRN